MTNEQHAYVYTAVVIAIALTPSVYKHFTSLRPDHTVQDFNAASVEKQAKYIVGMCDAGACLTQADWYCGFSNGPDNLVQDCFSKVIDTAKPWTTLGAISQFCGHQYMKFTGNTYAREESCKREGWKWGVPYPLKPLD